MNKAKLQETLQYFKDETEPINAELYMLYEDEAKNWHTYLPAIEEIHLQSALCQIAKSFIKFKFFIEKDDDDYEVVNVNTPEASNIRQVFHTNKADIPKASAIFDSIINDNTEDFPREAKLEQIWAYIIKISSHNGVIYLFKRNYQVNVLKKDFTYGLVFSNNMLKLFDKDLLRLSRKFDVILINNDLIILNRTEFEKSFDYVGAMQKSADNILQLIKKNDIISNIDTLDNLKGNKTTLRKLLNINPKSKILQKKPEQIAKLAKKYKVEFKIIDNGSHIDITTKKDAIAFVDLLNDDFLKSEFSDNLYKIKGKSKI